MEFTGFIKSISPVESRTSKNGKEYQIASVIIETQDAKPDSMVFTLLDAKITELVDIGVGNLVKVTWHCHVNAWQNRGQRMAEGIEEVHVAKIERQVVTQNAQPYQPSF